ncbi:PucR family transcriptional regulator [Blastococcus litoris]|uniref:PucR family transcriptional regulator n=1 Tax=Blastococcus litoris TaxID=2171622 RepID=UPI000E3048AE|nr:PucR family transcriptional regulator ligand-binding domain-containing protein [Blastococcus litoris]
MGITVNELVALPSVGTRFLAGRSGADRAVQWAHTCELPDPWKWLGTGDLLLSDGYNFPSDAAGQVRFLEELAHAALSGLALAEGMHAAPLTHEAIAAADALAFPVLETAYAVPFVTLVRTVADSNSLEASARLGKIIRMYDILRRSHQANFRGDPLLDQLSRDARIRLHVLDPQTGKSLLPTEVPIAPSLCRAVLDSVRDSGEPLPTFIRVTVSGQSALALPVGTGEKAVLLAEPLSAGATLDLVVLQHLATIAHLEVERRTAMALRRTEAGGRLLAQLLDGTVDVDTAEARLAALGLARKPWRAACIRTSAQADHDAVQLRLTSARIPHLVIRRADEVLALLPDECATTDLFDFEGDSRVSAGISQAVHTVKAVGDAARQARWAMEASRSEGRNVVFYGEQVPAFMPRTVTEGAALVTRILGPLITYDSENDSQLVHSLRVFLDSNRSWKGGAERLGIHRQTLVYRMRRVEELTGRHLQSLQDQTDLYLALKTLQLLGGEVPVQTSTARPE